MIKAWWHHTSKRLCGNRKSNWWERVDDHFTPEQLNTICAHCGERFGRHSALNGGCFSEAYTGDAFTPKEELK
jgi:hypothetical protein